MADLEFKTVENKEEWNNFVISQQRYSFVQSYEYTQVLTALVNEIVRIGVYDNGELIALLPIGIIKARRGRYLRLRHGPILSEKSKQLEIFKEIIEYIKEIAQQRDLAFIRIQPILENEELLIQSGFKAAPTHNLDGEHTLQLELNKFKEETIQKYEEKVMQNMRKNTRYYIRKAFKEGIEVVRDNSDFENFYKILKETSSRQGYTTWPKTYFENLFKYFSENQLSLYFATYKGRKIAIGLFLDYGKYRFYLEGGMDTEYSKQFPAYAIQWTSISDAIKKGQEIYDFWGGVAPKDKNGEPVKDYPWAGINLFKAGFGGEEVHMIHPYDNKISNKYWLTWLIEAIEKRKRGY